MVSLTKRAAVLGACIATVAIFGAGFLAGTLAWAPSYQQFGFLYDDFTIDACVRAMAEGQAADRPQDVLERVQICSLKLREQGAINEFQIRRVGFLNQSFSGHIVLWTVVALTLSGVAMAGYQIVAAARLAPDAAPAPSELVVERGRLFLRSSVTGLFILIVSFAFFYTYVVRVYTIFEIGETAAKPRAAEPAASGGDGPLIDGGGALEPDVRSPISEGSAPPPAAAGSTAPP